MESGVSLGSVGGLRDNVDSEKEWDEDDEDGEVAIVENFQKRPK